MADRSLVGPLGTLEVLETTITLDGHVMLTNVPAGTTPIGLGSYERDYYLGFFKWIRWLLGKPSRTSKGPVRAFWFFGPELVTTNGEGTDPCSFPLDDLSHVQWSRWAGNAGDMTPADLVAGR